MPLVHLWKPDQMEKGKLWSFQVLSARVPKKGEFFTFFFTIEMNEVSFPAMFVGKKGPFVKTTLIISFLLLSLNSFASKDKILIDASCKISCQTVVEVSYSEGNPRTLKKVETIYKEFKGLTREEIDSSTSRQNTNKLCVGSFGSFAVTENTDCIYFKH